MDKKKIILLFSALTLVLVASTSISLAWYNKASDIYVEQFNISLSSDPTLKLGVKLDETKDDITFYDKLTVNELGGTDIVFSPVSTMFKETWIDKLNANLKAEKPDDTLKVEPTFKDSYHMGQINDSSTYRNYKDAASGYFTKDIYLKSNKNVYCSISSDSSFSNDSTSNVEIAKTLKAGVYSDYSLEDIEKMLATTYKSLRYSFLYKNDKDETYSYLIYDPYKESTTYFAGPLDINKDSYYDYYTANSTQYEFLYGEYTNDNKVIYGLNSYNSDTTDTFNAKTKSGVNHVDLKGSISNGLSVKEEGSLSPTEMKKNKEVFKLTENEPYKVVLSIYLEGWDTDSTSLAMYGAFLASLKFEITEEIV